MNINTNLLYERAQHEGIPFFRWYKWVEETLSREVFKIIFHKKAEKKEDKKSKKRSLKDKILRRKPKDKTAEDRARQKSKVLAAIKKKVKTDT